MRGVAIEHFPFGLRQAAGKQPRVIDKVEFAARATSGAATDAMYQQLLRFMVLDEYLADHGIDE